MLRRAVPILFATVIALSGCGLADPPGSAGADPRAADDPDTLVVGSAPTLRPLEYVDENNEITGLIVDLIDAAAEEADISVRYEAMSFDALIPALQSDRIDMITSMGVLPERRETVTFVNYLESGASLLVEAGNPEDVGTNEDLCGLRVAFARGSSQQEMTRIADEACADAGRDRIESSVYDGSSETVLALRSGQVDAAWTDAVSASFILEETPDTYDVAYDEPGFGYGIGFAKEDVELRERFFAALQTLRENGTYEELCTKWSLQRGMIDEFQVNRGEGLGVPTGTPTP